MVETVFKLIINGVTVAMLPDGTFTIDSPQRVDVVSTVVQRPVSSQWGKTTVDIHQHPIEQLNSRKEFIKYINGPYTLSVDDVQQALNRLNDSGYLAFNRRSVIDAGNDVWLVKSDSKDEYYVVYKNGSKVKCSCPSFYYHHRNGGQCKHIGALVAQGVI